MIKSLNMYLDYDIFRYCILKTLKSPFNIEICNNSNVFISNIDKKFNKLENNDKTYYSKYSLTVLNKLLNHLGEIKNVTINPIYSKQSKAEKKSKNIKKNKKENNSDIESDTNSSDESDKNENENNENDNNEDENIIYDFIFNCKKGKKYISFSHQSIMVNNIIPFKLMKICKYHKQSNVYKQYINSYNTINDNAYEKLKKNEKYSNVSDKKKEKILYTPIIDLVIETLNKKRKCAKNIYNYIFSDGNRIIVKLYKNRFYIYDFDVETSEINSIQIKKKSTNVIRLSFNNNTKFLLTLKTNGTKINEHISLKFKTQFSNLDEIYLVESCKV